MTLLTTLQLNLGPAPGKTAYWVAHTDSTWPGTPTGAQIAAGNLSNGSPASYTGSETAPSSGTGFITEATAISGLAASTDYRLAWVVYDPGTVTYSNVVVSGVITTSAASGAFLAAWARNRSHVIGAGVR